MTTTIPYSPAPGYLVTANGAAGGDLTGTYPDPTLASISAAGGIEITHSLGVGTAPGGNAGQVTTVSGSILDDGFGALTSHGSIKSNSALAVGSAAPPAIGGTLATAPPATSVGPTVTLGATFQNTLGYDAHFLVTVRITAATSATLAVGVNPTNVTTAQSFMTALTSAAVEIIPISLYVPQGYYGIISTGGTITASVDSCIAMPV